MHQILENETALAGILLTGLIIAVVLGNFIFHTLTKGHHFREWKEFEPLDAPIPKTATGATVHHAHKLRNVCYNLLISTLSIKLNHPTEYLKSEHIIYPVLKHFCSDFVPNSSTDHNDIKFSLLVLKVISKLQVMEVAEIRKFMQETFPNQNF